MDPAPRDSLHVVRRLECLQLDPVALIGRNQDLVLGARLQQPPGGILDGLLSQGNLIEYEANAACIMPIEDMVWLKGIQVRRQRALQPQLDSLGPVVKHVLDRLAREGPLPAREFVSQERVAGYWDSAVAATKATSHALNVLRDVGMIRVVARDKGHRLFDLMERGIEASLLDRWRQISIEDADRGLLNKYIRAYGIMDPSDPRFGWRHHPIVERTRLVEQCVQLKWLTPLAIESLPRPYYVATDLLERLEHYRDVSEVPIEEASIRFLPPLDNLLWRRERLEDIFDFSYRWEIYIPESKRQYGAYVMPILAGSRLIGRVNARCLREEQRLQVMGVWWEPEARVTPTLIERFTDSLAQFSTQLGMKQIDFLVPLAPKEQA